MDQSSNNMESSGLTAGVHRVKSFDEALDRFRKADTARQARDKKVYEETDDPDAQADMIVSDEYDRIEEEFNAAIAALYEARESRRNGGNWRVAAGIKLIRQQ